MSDYFRYHGLGNDYLVMEPAGFSVPLNQAMVRKICDRQRGVGSDGILWGPLPAPLRPGDEAGAIPLRIYNPDGSEAEKSGNGLRIFARHLWERGLASTTEFAISTLGGVVRARILDSAGGRISIEMGRVRFDSESIPMTGPAREVLGESLQVDGREFSIHAANVGNPHCVVICEAPDEALARRYGPGIENHPIFPNRTNVQFMALVGEQRIRIVIWERGAGYTQASGSSSCAAAAVACRLGHCRSPVVVEMAGGELEVGLDASFRATLTGPVASVGKGKFAPEFLRELGLSRV